MNELMTSSELSAYYKVSRQTIKNWVKQGCPVERIGKLLRFRLADIELWNLQRSNNKIIGR